MKKRNTMRHAITLISLWSFTLAACGDGCQCTPPVETDAGQPTGRLVISSPLNGATMTAFDDDYPSVEGINIDVNVVAENLADGTMVSLTNSAGGESIAPVAVAAGRALFEQLTLLAGDPPDGLLNTLSVSASGATGDSVDLTVLGQASTLCRFVSPVDGDVLDTDSNPGMDYFQTDVVVACSGSALAANAEVTLQINGGTARTVALSAGTATFTAVTLDEGSNQLAAHSVNLNGDTVGETSISVEVDTGACDAIITAPVAGVLNAQETDLLPSTPNVLDMPISVHSERCPAGSVTMELSGSMTGASGSLSSGSGVIQVALPQGPSLLVAIVQDASHNAGRSPQVSYDVDTIVPEIVVSSPVADAVLGASDDEESPANPDNGLTYTFAGTVNNAADTTLSMDVLLDGTAITGSPFDVVINPADGHFERQLVNLVGGNYQVDFYALDVAGNAVSQTINFTVDLAVPVLSLVVTSDADSNDMLNIAEDASADANYQVELRASLSGVSDYSLYMAELRAQPVDAAGQAQGDAIVLTAPFAASGLAYLHLDLTEGGHYDLRVYSLRAGMYSEPSAEHIVLVDFIAPDLAINSPVNDSVRADRSLNLLAMCGAVDFDPASPVLSINGSAVTAQAVVQTSTITYNGLTLSGASDDSYILDLSIADIVGNTASTSVRVVVDQVAPTVTLSGWASATATERHIELSALESSPTWLHLDQDETLDYDLTTDGLQFGFQIVVTDETALTLGVDPQASLKLSGMDQPIFAPLVDDGSGTRFVATFTGDDDKGISLDDGPFDATAAVVDVASNAGQDQRYALVQSSQYYVQISEPTEGQIFASATGVTVHVATSVFEGASCDLQLDGSNFASSQAVASGALTFANVDLGAAGAHTLQVICDLGSGQSQSSQIRNVVVDLSAPTGLAFLTSATDTVGHLPASGYFNLAWTSTGTDFERAVQVQLDAENGACPFADPTLTLTPTVPAGTAVQYDADGQTGGQWTLDGSVCLANFSDVDLADFLDAGQSVQFDVNVADLAGNAAAAQTSVTVDRVAPTLVQTLPAVGVTELGRVFDDNVVTDGLQMTGQHRWTFSVDDSAVVGDVVLTYSGAASGTVSSVAQVGTVRVATDWASDGVYSVVVQVSDAAGNQTVMNSVDYTVDLDVPTMTLRDKNYAVLAEENRSISDDNSAPVDWGSNYDVSADSGGQFNLDAIIDGVRGGFWVQLCSDRAPANATEDCQVSAGGTGLAVTGKVVDKKYVTAPSGYDQGYVTFELVNLLQGNQNLYIESDDEAGNHAATYPVEVNIDTYAPQLTSIALAENLANNDAACTGLCINASENGGDIVVYVNNGGDNEDLAGRQLVLSSDNGGDLGTKVLAGSSPTFSATFSSVNLAEGTHHLTATMTDLIGNALDNSTGTNPELFVDVSLPTISAHNPAATAQYANSTFDVSLTVGDNNATDGYAVVLNNTTTSASLNGTVSNGGALFADVVMQDNASNSLTATVTDLVGNVSAAYTFSYDVDTSAPSLSLLAPTTDLSKTQTGGSCMVISDYHVSFAGVNRTANTHVELLARAFGSSDSFGVVSGSPAGVSADSTDYQFTSPCFAGGDWDVQARIYEDDTAHESMQTYTSKLSVDLQSPIVNLKVAANDDTVSTGYAFLKNLDTNVAVGTYETSFTVESLNAHQGAAVRLYVNGSQVGGDQALAADLTYTFNGIALHDFGATGLKNEIYAEVEDAGVTGTSSVALDCIADGDVPTIEFNDTAARTLLYADDSDHSAAGWQASVGTGLVFTTTGIGGHETVSATLTCSAVASDLTGAISSNAGEFGNMPGIVTSATDYVCSLSVSDTAGNSAVSSDKTLTVDIDRPSIPSVVACIGEDTGTESYEKDDNSGAAKCDDGSFGGACGNGTNGIDTDKCSRRATNVALTWVAPGDDGDAGAKVTSYNVIYKPSSIAENPDCSDMSGATSVNTSGMTIVAAGQQQTFVVANLGVHKDYCFQVTATDAVGNASTSTAVLRRVPLRETSAISGDNSNFAFRMFMSADIDADGMQDLIIGDPGYTEDDTANRGKMLVHFADSNKSDVIITYPTAHADDRFGYSVSGGDFNGDGFDDVLVSEKGTNRVYVYFGSSAGLGQNANSTDGDLPSLTPDTVIDGGTATYNALIMPNRKFNFNNDQSSAGYSVDDIAVYDKSAKTLYIIQGHETSWASSLTLTSSDMSIDFSGDLATSGWSNIMTAGDFDGDSHTDLALGITQWGDHGRVYLVYGRDTISGSLQYPNSASGVVSLGDDTTNSNYGQWVVAFDATDDAVDDLAVLDGSAKLVQFYKGVLGTQGALSADGSVSVSYANDTIESMGDISGDAFADLCVGDYASSADNPGDLLFYAGSSTGVDSLSVKLQYSEKDAEFGSQLASNGDFNGDGYIDMAVADKNAHTVTILY